MTSVGVIATLLTSAACVVTSADTVELADRQLRVRDVVDLTCIEPDQRLDIGETPIAQIPLGVRETTLTHGAVVALARRAVPFLGDIRTPETTDSIHILAPVDTPESVSRRCFAASRDILVDELIPASAVSQTQCEANTSRIAAIRYDRVHGVTRAAVNLRAGDYVGPLLVSDAAQVDGGNELALTVRVGPVAVARLVTTLQPSRGLAVFVRDRDGHVFAAPTPNMTGQTP